MSEVKIPTEVEIRKMDLKIEDLKRRVNLTKEADQRVFDTQLRTVEDRFDLVKAKFDRLKMKTGAATHEVGTGLVKAWEEVQASYEKAKEYLH